MNLLGKWYQQARLSQLQNLRTWLEQVNLHDLYGNGLGKIGDVSCQYYQDEAERSKVAVIADGRKLIEIVCFHEGECYQIETLVRIIDLDDNVLTPENYLMAVLFLLDEINGYYPWGFLVNRMEGALGEVHLCWRANLSKETMRNENVFVDFLRRQLSKFLFEELAPHIEEEFTEFVSLIRRSSEFNLSEDEE